MAKNNNLNDFLTDVANAIRTKKGTTAEIDAQDFGSEIASIPTGSNTLKTLLDTTKSCYYLFYNYQGYSVANLLTYSDTENVTNMTGIFSGCSKLTSIPLLDTSSATSVSGMFSHCSSITTIPLLDTSSATSMGSMFYQCTSLKSIPLLDTSSVTDLYGVFYGCSKLTAIPELDFSKVTSMSSTFYNCSKLTQMRAYGMKTSFDIHWSTLLTASELEIIFNNLATVTTATTLTLGSTLLNKLTSTQKAIATGKGWTLA